METQVRGLVEKVYNKLEYLGETTHGWGRIFTLDEVSYDSGIKDNFLRKDGSYQILYGLRDSNFFVVYIEHMEEESMKNYITHEFCKKLTEEEINLFNHINSLKFSSYDVDLNSDEHLKKEYNECLNLYNELTYTGPRLKK